MASLRSQCPQALTLRPHPAMALINRVVNMDTKRPPAFAARLSVEQVEEGQILLPNSMLMDSSPVSLLTRMQVTF